MKATLLLRNDHVVLQNMLNKFGKTPNDRVGKQLFAEIQREIQVHSQISSEIFYSALEATPSDRAAGLVMNAQKNHMTLQKLLKELEGMNASDPGFGSKMEALITELSRHIDMEEEELFQEARKSLPECRLEQLGLEMQDRKKVLTMLASA